jgi:hypothetical protein
VTVIIFVVTLTKGAPAFLVIIIALVLHPTVRDEQDMAPRNAEIRGRLGMQEGTPEDDEDAKARADEIELLTREPNLQSDDAAKQTTEDGIV